MPWFSKTEGNTYSTLLHHPFLFKEIQCSAQEVARRISGAVAGEVRTSQDLTPDNEPFLVPLPGSLCKKSTYQVPITIPISRITLFAICLSFSSPPLHPCRFIRPFSIRLDVFLGSFSRLVEIVEYLFLNREPKIYGSSSAC